MTHDEMIEVIAAHRDGKALEWRYRRRDEPYNPWRDAPPPVVGGGFDFMTHEFRIKPSPPKPRELFIRLHADGTLPVSGIVTSFSELPILASHWQNGDQIIKVREVLPSSGEK